MSNNEATDRLQELMDARDKAYEEAHRLSRDLWQEAADSGLGVSELGRLLGVSRGTIHGWFRQMQAESETQKSEQ